MNFKMNCPFCDVEMEVPGGLRNQAAQCPDCEREFTAREKIEGMPVTQPPEAKIKRSPHYNTAVLLQFLGFAVLLFFGLTMNALALGGVAMICFGAILARGVNCSKCGNKLHSKEVKLCPTCKSALAR